MLNLEERVMGPFRIYTGATPHRGGGYVGAVFVRRFRDQPSPLTVYACETVNSGHRYPTVRGALDAAMALGLREVESRAVT